MAQIQTRPSGEIYDTRDAGRASTTFCPNLYHALRTRIGQFTVEFLYTNEVKPHVVFKLNFANRVNKRFSAAYFSMEMAAGMQGPGFCRIKLCGYTGRTERATAGFQFECRGQRTLGDLVALVQGEHPSLPRQFQGDLTPFDFVEVNEDDGYFDGCRDWIAQAFVRMNAMGWVGWSIIGILGPDSRPMNRGLARETLRAKSGHPAIDWRTAGFHDVIGKFFDLPVEDRSSEATVVYHHELPLEHGHFHSRNVVRSYQDSRGRYTLPYSQLPAQVDSSSGRGSGSGGRSGGYGSEYGGGYNTGYAASGGYK